MYNQLAYIPDENMLATDYAMNFIDKGDAYACYNRKSLELNLFDLPLFFLEAYHKLNTLITNCAITLMRKELLESDKNCTCHK